MASSKDKSLTPNADVGEVRDREYAAALESELNRWVARVADAEAELRKVRRMERELRAQLGRLQTGELGL